MFKFALVATTLALAFPAPALANPYRLTVTQTGPKDFTVTYKANAKPTDYWCAAGLYAARTLGLGDLARVYRMSPPHQHVGQGVSFTLDPARSVGTTGITTFGGKQDGGMYAGSAVAEFCYDWHIMDDF